MPISGKKALTALRKAGFEIPKFRMSLFMPKRKKEAVEEIAAYNSEFGRKIGYASLRNTRSIRIRWKGSISVSDRNC